MKKWLSVFLFLSLVSCDSPSDKATESQSPASTTPPHDSFNLTEVAEGVYVHQGLHVDIDHEDHTDIANTGFIIGDECVAVIDTGGSVAIGEKLRTAIKEKTETPICYVINSHVHFDHVLGNAAFKQDNPKFVGHINLADTIEQNREFFAESFSVTEVVGPDMLVEEVLTLDLGNREILLTANPKAHTTTDLTVLDQKTNTLFLGDLLFIDRAPSLDGSTKGWFQLMESLHDHDYAQVVPGHGPASADWPEAMQAQQTYFKVLIDETRQAISDGVSLGDAVKTVGQSEKDKWLLFDAAHQRAVNRTYRELEWE